MGFLKLFVGATFITIAILIAGNIIIINDKEPEQYVPKFKAKDCIVDIDTTEFKQTYKPFYKRILKVGKTNYLYTSSKYDFSRDERDITITDEFYELTDSKHCEKRGF